MASFVWDKNSRLAKLRVDQLLCEPQHGKQHVEIYDSVMGHPAQPVFSHAWRGCLPDCN